MDYCKPLTINEALELSARDSVYIAGEQTSVCCFQNWLYRP